MENKIEEFVIHWGQEGYYDTALDKAVRQLINECGGKCTIPVVSGSLPLASGSVTKTREPLPTYYNKCDLCGEIFWTKDAFNNKCPECGREGWQRNDR